MWGRSLTEVFHLGGWVMWPLLACSVMGLALILERSIVFLFLRDHFGFLSRKLKPLLTAGRVAEAEKVVSRTSGPIAKVVAAYLKHTDSPARLRDEVVGRVASEQLARLELRLNWLSMIAHIAPLLGLLGTVAGLVTAFNEISSKGGQVRPDELADGIWAALLTTVFGLTVAIPCMAVFHLLDSRVSGTAMKIEWLISYMNEWLKGSSFPLSLSEERPVPTKRQPQPAEIGVASD